MNSFMQQTLGVNIYVLDPPLDTLGCEQREKNLNKPQTCTMELIA